jgi:hypothetical protein
MAVNAVAADGAATSVGNAAPQQFTVPFSRSAQELR